VNSGQWSIFFLAHWPFTGEFPPNHHSLRKSMRQNISGGSPFEPIIGFSRAVRVGNVIHLAGTGPVGADNLDAEGQTRRVFAIASEALERAGSSLNDVVRTRMYLTQVQNFSIPPGVSKSKWKPSFRRPPLKLAGNGVN
jgi:enamine deaminase RidA (YjgF/YER057c/UK114 family)